MKKIWNYLFVENLKIETAKLTNNQQPNAPFHTDVAMVLVISALSLTFIHFFGSYHYLIKFTNQIGLNQLSESLKLHLLKVHNPRLFTTLYWSICSTFFYLIIPAIYIIFFAKRRMSDYGFKAFDDIRKEIPIYLVFVMIMLPLVITASHLGEFKQIYPFYKLGKGESLWPAFVIWELTYFIQFIAIEFFFRGFLVHGTKKVFGFYSIFVMMVPYCMIHYTKAFPEAMSAILAGIALGALSLRKGAIGTGVALHYTVALSMDLLSLYNQGYFR